MPREGARHPRSQAWSLTGEGHPAKDSRGGAGEEESQGGFLGAK